MEYGMGIYGELNWLVSPLNPTLYTKNTHTDMTKHMIDP